MTPHQLNMCVDAFNDKSISDTNDMIRLAYMHMQIMRSDPTKTTKLENLLIGKKKPVPAFDETAIINRMKAHNAQLKKIGTKNGKCS